MRIVVALGGNALAKRGQPMTAEMLRYNIRSSVVALGDLARDNEVVITHGNGPQVGLLALQGLAYNVVPPYPLDILVAESQGMIGYPLQEALSNELGVDREVVTVLTTTQVYADDPGFENPTKPVAIVESEKSALIATHYMPEFIWLATGGMHGCFKSDVVSVLKGRSVMLCPDLGAREVWQTKMALLISVCSKVVLSDSLEQCATDEQRKNGLDIADFLLMTETPAMILQKMIKRNPNLQTLIDYLHLELVDSG